MTWRSSVSGKVSEKKKRESDSTFAGIRQRSKNGVKRLVKKRGNDSKSVGIRQNK